MHIKFIGCEVLAREAYYCASKSKNTVDIQLFSLGLHSNPAEGNKIIQEAINNADNKGFDAIVIGYVLCSNMIAELKAGKTKLVVARAHDCITLMLGSHKRYMDFFDKD